MNRKSVAFGLVAALVFVLVLSMIPMPVAAIGGTVTLQSSAGSPIGTCASSPCSFGSVTTAGSDTGVYTYITSTGGEWYNVTSYVCGGNTLTKLTDWTIGTFGSTFAHIYVFYGVGLPVGTLSCTLTYTGSSVAPALDAAGWSWTFSNVNQASPNAQTQKATGTGSGTYKVTFASPPPSHDLMIDFVQVDGGAGIAYPTAGTGQTAVNQAGQGAPPNAVLTTRSWKAGATNSTMYWGEGGTTVNQWSLYGIDINSDFIAATPNPNPSQNGGSGNYWWTGAGQWTGGTYNTSNLQVVGNCLQLIAGKTDGQWTSAVQTITLVIVGVNITYSGTDASNFVSVVAIQDQNSVNLWKDGTLLWQNGGANLSTGSVLIQSKYQLTFTLHSGNGGTPQVCVIGVQTQVQHNSPPPFDWTPYIIVMVVFVIVAVIVIVVIKYL